MTLPHVEDERLAQLAEGNLSATEADAIRRHLGECRSCLAVYVDAVRYRAAWLADSDAFRPDGGEAKLARERRGREGTPVPRRPRGHERVFVPTTIAVLAAVAAIFGLRSGRDAPAALRLQPAVEAALSRAPADGLLLPGVTPRAIEMRSGSATSSATVDAAVKEAVAAYESRRDDVEACARLVAALLASGEVETANVYAAEGLGAHPTHVPLLVLAAEARLRANDLPAAEKLLRRAASRSPGDPLVALDLGIVLRQTDRAAKARAKFEQAARAPSAVVAERARRELESLRRR